MKESTAREIVEERLLQDAEWGGPDRDDRHTFFDWRDFLYKQITAASMEGDVMRQRKRLVKIAALAVAAIESTDRRAARLSDGTPP